MKKIGITGGSGLLGKLLTKELKKKKINYSLFNKDITNKDHIKNWFLRNRNIEYIFHFAAYTYAEKAKTNKKKAFNTNVLGTKNLIEVLNIKKKKRLLFFPSTSHVYKYSSKPIKENFSLKPTSFYGKTKLLAEKKIRENKCKYFQYCIVRIFSIFHKNQKKPFLYPSIKNKLKRIKSSNVYIKGANNVRDFSNADKITKIIFKIFEKKLTGVYNIGSGKGMTIKDFINKNIDEKKTIIDYKKPNSLIADIKKLKRKIGIKNV